MARRRSPVHALARFGTRLRTRGVAEVARVAFERIVEAIASEDVLILFVRPAGGSAPVLDGFEFRHATAADADAYAAQIGTDSPRTFAARLGTGDRCYLVVAGDRIVHATWMTRSGAWTREIRRCLRPPEGDAYIYESFTDPTTRGRGIYPFAISGIAADLGREAVRSIWVGVVGDNDASLRAIAKGGFSEAFRVRYRRRVGALVLGVATGPRADEAERLLVRCT